MRNYNDIVSLISEKEHEIINNISIESIDVYKFLQDEFKKGNVNTNYLFQFVYRSFYRIDNAGLTDEFKIEYFKIMEEKRFSYNLDPQEIFMRLYLFKTRQDKHTIQFSFSTKLIHTINVDFPIYDSNIAKVFNFPTSYLEDIKKRVIRYLDQQNIIIEVYKSILDKKLLISTIQLFDKTFIDNKLPNIKKLDFIFWSCGKIL